MATKVYLCYNDLDDLTEFVIYDSMDKALDHFDYAIDSLGWQVGDLIKEGHIVEKELL